MEGKKINDNITVTGQITPEMLKQAANEGFKSILNLRASGEEGFMSDEGKQAEAAGLTYLNIPVKKEEISDELTSQVLKEIDGLPNKIVFERLLPFLYSLFVPVWIAAIPPVKF